MNKKLNKEQKKKPKKILSKNDLCFKKVFASPQYRHILKGFIKDIVGLDVVDLSIENPYDIMTYYEKDNGSTLLYTTIDVTAQLSDNTIVNIELQLQPHAYFKERAAYYGMEKYTSGYGRREYFRIDEKRNGAKYSSLYPVFQISILDFNMFKNDQDPIRRFTLYDVEHQEYYTMESPLTLVFLELQKQQGTQKQIQFWLDYFTTGAVSEDAPDYLKEACQIVDYQNLNEEERNMVDKYEKAKEDYLAAMQYREEEGERRGVKKGEIITQISLILRNTQKGGNPEEIADILGVDTHYVEKIIQLNQVYPNETAQELAQRFAK